ncbi:MAG TPA: hypothetical protein VEU47_09895 [Candidatus Cybelea sp.]|nr:hypothetical protein [Candidatus Cybelea sp.]
MRLLHLSAARLSAAVIASVVAFSLSGCVGLVVAGAAGAGGAAGGLAVAEDKKREAARDDNYVPPAQRVPPSTDMSQGAAMPSAPQPAVTSEPLPPPNSGSR